MESNTSVKELAFLVPTDVMYEQPVSELSRDMLERYHDVLHVLFNKLQDGLGEFREFTWTFNKVIFKHSEVVREMEERGIRHYYPINDLDKVHAFPELIERDYKSQELSKENSEENTFDFSPDNIERINSD